MIEREYILEALVQSQCGVLAAIMELEAHPSEEVRALSISVQVLAGVKSVDAIDARLTTWTERARLARSSEWWTLVLANAARSSLWRLDIEQFVGASRALEAMEPPPESFAATRRVLPLEVHGWLTKGASSTGDTLAGLEREAVARGFAAEAVELAALRALVGLNEGERASSLQIARRASRMGRTESMPQAEYFAGLVLARARRLAGQPHLSALILSALRAVAPATWQPWLDWELAMAAGEVVGASEPARSLLAALGRGELPIGSHEAAPASLPYIESDWVRVSIALGKPDVRGGPLADWRSGLVHDPVDGLHGLAGLGASDGPLMSVFTCVVVPKDGNAFRRVAVGLGDSVGRCITPTRKGKQRRDALLAAIALAGPEGIAEADLFKEIYGFVLAQARQGTFDVLAHRARQALPPEASIVRAHGRFSISTSVPLVLADPRCGLSIEHRLLQILACEAGTSSKAAAQRLNVPLRTVQSAFENLVKEEACVRERGGQGVLYRMADTTFQPPTQSG